MTVAEEIVREEPSESELNEVLNEDLDNSNAENIAAAALADFDEEDESDKKDDTVNVIIKNPGRSVYKTGANYQSKTSNLTQKTAKTGVDIDDPGDINGKPTIEYNVSDLQDEDKPWKRPGADLTDYFNYGFTEETWLRYCEKQKVIRMEYANSTLKPLSSTNYIAGMHPKPRPNKIDTIVQPVFNPYMTTSAAFNQNLVNVMNNPPNQMSIVGDLGVPPPVIGGPGFPGMWNVNNDNFPNFINQDNHNDDSGSSDRDFSRRSKRDYREVEGYGSRGRHRSRSDSESRYRKRRRDERELERGSRRERSGDRSRRHRSRSRSRNRRRNDSRDRDRSRRNNDRSERSGRDERPDRGDKSERTNRSERGEKPEKNDRPEKSDRGERSERDKRDRDQDKSSSRRHDSRKEPTKSRHQEGTDSMMPDENIISSGSNPPNPDNVPSSMIVIQNEVKQDS